MRLKPTQYAEQRARFLDALGPDAVAIVSSPAEKIRSNDSTYPYRPSSDVVYLSGFEEPETVLLFAPGHPDGEFVMFVPPRDPERETWDGVRYGVEGATSVFGADAAFSIEEIDEVVPKYLAGRQELHYAVGSDPRFDDRVTSWLNKLRHRRGAAPAAPRALVDVRDALHELRLRKSPAELETMRRAAEIASQAHIRAMRATRPGLYEYQVQAELEYHFLQHGADFPAYTSIVGGGVNATILHYVTNRSRLKAGDLLLIDAGCELDFYAADITRTFPVAGTFEGAARDVYAAVLEAQKAAIEDVTLGTRYNVLRERTTERLTDALIQLGALSGSVDENIESKAYLQFYPHGVGHWLGMDVHDVGSYFDADGEWRKLETGMVVTVEPGLYFPVDDTVPPQLRGIGVRIEDDVVVTASGPENLTISCPKEIAEIEEIVGTNIMTRET